MASRRFDIEEPPRRTLLPRSLFPLCCSPPFHTGLQLHSITVLPPFRSFDPSSLSSSRSPYDRVALHRLVCRDVKLPLFLLTDYSFTRPPLPVRRVSFRDKEARSTLDEARFAPVFSPFASSTYTHRGYGDVRQGGGMIATIHLVVRRRRRCPRRRATPASWRLDSAVRRGTHALLDTDGRDSSLSRRLSSSAIFLRANFSREFFSHYFVESRFFFLPFFFLFFIVSTRSNYRRINVSSTFFGSSVCRHKRAEMKEARRIFQEFRCLELNIRSYTVFKF